MQAQLGAMPPYSFGGVPEVRVTFRGDAGVLAGDIRFRVSRNHGYLFGRPHTMAYGIWGLILGSLDFGKLSFCQAPIHHQEGRFSA